MSLAPPDLDELTALVEQSLDAIVSIDGTGRVRSFNPAAERLFQYDAADVVGQSVNQLMSAADAAAHDGFVQRYLDTGERRIIGSGRAVQCRRRDGTQFTAHLWVTEHASTDGRVFTAVLHDLSDRLRIADELARTREQLSLTVEYAPIGIATLDIRGRILGFNRAASRTSGYARDELLGFEGINFMHVDDQQHIRRSLRALLTQRIDHSISTHRMRAAKGGLCASTALHCCCARQQRPATLADLYVRGSHAAIGGPKQSCRWQRERLAHIARIDTMGEMAVGLAHELNQPLSAITTYTHAAEAHVSQLGRAVARAGRDVRQDHRASAPRQRHYRKTARLDTAPADGTAANLR